MKKYILVFISLLSITAAFISPSYAGSEPTSQVSSETGKVNINTADAGTLASILKGVGLKKAEAIIEYRKTYGPFHNIQELAEVSGIGKSIVEKNVGMIAVK